MSGSSDTQSNNVSYSLISSPSSVRNGNRDLPHWHRVLARSQSSLAVQPYSLLYLLTAYVLVYETAQDGACCDNIYANYVEPLAASRCSSQSGSSPHSYS